MHHIKEKFNKQIAQYSAEIIINPLPIISGIRPHIDRLFLNLIDNAFKFRSTKPLAIHIFAIDQKEHWQFHVCDNGIGINNQYHESIFNMFNRLHNHSEYEGSGIGLAVCKEIVHKHKGTISVQSTPNNGSEFIITLPKLFNLDNS